MNTPGDHLPHDRFCLLLCRLGTKEGGKFLAKALGFLILLGLLSSHVTVDSQIHDTMARFKASIRRMAAGRDGAKQNKIVILRLDDEAWARSTTNFNNPSVPFPREVLADVIQAVGEARPGAIVLDIALEEPGAATADEKLAAAIRTNGLVMLAQDIQKVTNTVCARPLAAIFASTRAPYAPAFFKDDEDRLIRRVPLYACDRGTNRMTLPLLVATRVAPRAMPSTAQVVPLEFPAPPGEFFPSFSAAALLRWKLEKKDVGTFFGNDIQPSNTVVLIGPFHAASRDQFPVPGWLGDSYGQVAGTHLIGYAIHTLSASRWPWQAPAWSGYGLLALFFAWGFIAVCLQFRWPAGGALNWRSLFPIAYGLVAMGLTLWPGWFLPVTLPLTGYGAGRTLGELFCERFGHEPLSSSPQTTSRDTPESELASPS